MEFNGLNSIANANNSNDIQIERSTTGEAINDNKAKK